MGPGDLGAFIALIGVLAGVGVLAGAFAGAYFFGKSKVKERLYILAGIRSSWRE